MTRAIKNVALAGPTGNVGKEALKALLDLNKFKVTVLVRKAGGSFPDNVTVTVVDYSSAEALKGAVQGQDAVIDARPSTDGQALLPLIDAAAAAGVYRFVPTDYGFDPTLPGIHDLPVFQGKGVSYRRVLEKSKESGMTYTVVACGPFLDYCLSTGFLGIDVVNKRTTLYDDGNHPVPGTTLAEVGRATAALLLVPEQTANRPVYVHNVVKSQRQIIALAKEALGSEGWEDSGSLDMDEVLRKSLAELKAGNFDYNVFADQIRYGSARKEYGGPWPRNDNALLGLEEWSDAQFKEFIKELAARR